MTTNPNQQQASVDRYNAEVAELEPGATPEAIYGPPAERRFGPFPAEMTGGAKSNLVQEPFVQQAEDPSLFAGVEQEEEPVPTLFDDVPAHENFDEYRTAVPTTMTTILTTLATMNPNEDPITQLNEQTIAETYKLLERNEERVIRNKLAVEQQARNLEGIKRLIRTMGTTASPESIAATTQAYNNVLNWDLERRARIAVENEAIDRIQDMAVSDPVQAKVLLNLLEKGDAEKTVRDHNIRMSILAQRAEELDAEYNQSGWGRAILNFVLNLAPTNYNFARSGIVTDGGITDILAVGESIREQNEALFNRSDMTVEEFAEYAAKDGPLMQSIRSNATTIFDMTSDPGMAVEIFDKLVTQTDNARTMSNIWGGVELASVVPYATIGRATRNIVQAGATREAVRNLDNYVRVMDEAGPEAASRATGVSEGELVEELSVSALNPSRAPDEVPLSEQLATRREAAQQALREIYDPAQMERFSSSDEIVRAFEGTVDEVQAEIGRPVKDVAFKHEPLSGGANVRYVEFTIGKKDGHGFASPSAARAFATKHGYGDAEVIELVETPRGAPIAPPRSNVRELSHEEYVDEFDPSEMVEPNSVFYRYQAIAPNGAVADIYLNVNKTTGIGKIDIGGFDAHNFGPREVRAIAAQLADEIPNLKRLQGERVTGARAQVELDASRFLTVDDMRAQRPDGSGGYDIRGLVNDLSDDVKEALDQGHTVIVSHHGTQTRIRGVTDDGKFIRADGSEWDISEFVSENAQNSIYIENTKVIDSIDVLADINVEPLRGRMATQVFQDQSGQFFARIRKNIAETQWYQNELHPPAQGFLSKMFGRWVRSSARITDGELHGRALEVGTRLNRAHKVIKGEIEKAFGGLNKQSQNILRAVLTVGARRGRWFNDVEFSALVERQLGRAATDAEKKAYHRFRELNDMDWELRNTAIYVNKVYEGYESASFGTRWGQTFDVDARVDRGLDQIPVERVYDASRNKHYTKQNNPLSRETLEKMKSEGYVMLRLDEPMVLPEGVKTNLVLIKKTDVSVTPLRKEQLAYSEGGHRMYVDPVFVKQGRKGTQADTGAEYLEAPGTFRTAANIAEGRKWAATMERARLALKENPGLTETDLDDVIFRQDPAYPTGREFLDMVDSGEINLDNPFEAVWNRELPSMYQQSGEDMSRLYDENELGITGYYRTTGRMYTSAKGEILKNTKGEVADILDPYDTLTTSLEQVTRLVGLQNYKTEALNRFANTYRQFLDIQPNHRFPSQILTEAKVRPDVPVEVRNQIEAQRDAILNVLRYETPSEKAARQMWQSTAEFVIGTGDNAARKFAHDALWWWKERGPLQQLRGLVFDMKLGMFNPGQLFVQISTMVSALALSPKYGWQGMSGLMPMHAYLLSKGSENMLDTLAKRGVHKVMGFADVDEFKDYARHLHLHGFPDMNGSHVMIRDYGPQAHFGSLSEKGNNLREQGRVFFYTAETWNRLVAYRIAWGEAKDKGLQKLDPTFNETVLRLADDYSMNMTNESAAYWQKGILSIPTQFWAYNVRMMDAMLGKRFTPAQRIRLAIAQMGMAGTAGIPGLGALSEYIKQQSGEAPDIDSLEGVLDRGLIDYINFQLTGQDIMIGERVGTGGWASETVRALFGASEYGERSFIDIVGGATYSIAKKTAEGGWATVGALAAYAAAESGSDMGERAIARDKLLTMLKEVSTFGNATKAMMIHQYGMYLSNKGAVLASDLPAGNAIYTALSFRPAKTDEISYLIAYRQDKEESLKEVATQLRNWRQEALSNPDKFEENMQKANALVRLLPAGDRQEVIKQTNRIMDKSFYDYVDRKVQEEKLREGPVE